VHLVGFIIKKSVLMHGHMNVIKSSSYSWNYPLFVDTWSS